MSRTATNTVEYFPHLAKQGKTIFILKSRFGNNGYAFWFQLLEILSQSENHFYDCREENAQQYLLSFCGSNAITGTEILDLLAILGNIDPGLWKQKVIWCPALVENIADVYKKRGRPIPLKPVLDTSNAIPDTSNTITGTEMPQSKVKDIEVKDIKVNKGVSPPEGNGYPDWLNKETWEAFLEMRKEKKAKPTEHAKKLIIAELDKLRLAGDDPTAVLNRSIISGWKDVFPLKKEGGKYGQGAGANKPNPKAILKAGQFTDPNSLG